MPPATKRKQPKKGSKTQAKKKVPYHHKPEEFSLDQWQTKLRKQFAETQSYSIKNLGNGVVFSDYQVYNPDSKNSYKVAIRGAQPGWNFCSCPDFKTNQLGTCKHIEYLLYQFNKKPKTRRILTAGYHPHYTSVFLSYGQQREVKIRIGDEKKSEFTELASAFFDSKNTLKLSAYGKFDDFLTKAYILHPDFRCYPDALEFILDKRAFKSRNKQIDKALKQREPFFKSIIKADLFPYQQEGVEFALRRGRCLIADDMGLGKTLQAIAAAEAMKKLFGISKVLIICPTSLKYQWKSEIEKFTQSSLTVIEGNMRVREKHYADENFYKICSYQVVGRDIEAININDFDLVILDEAQRIKNWKTMTAVNVKKVQSKYCIVLTGTPLENKLEELYSVVQMVDPLHLGALFRFVSAHQITEGPSNKVIGYKDLDKIGVLLKDILIRRLKSVVLKQLPARMDKNLFVPMTASQLDYYNEAYELVVKLVGKWNRFHFLNESDRQKLLINLNVMRMACDSTYIIDQQTRHDTKIDELMNILEEAFENGVEKVVVFSQWERMTRIIAEELEARSIGFESLHGGIPSKDREILFTNFREKKESKVFLSTDAGGVGLNLQSASLLINMDLPWNPAVLEQRIARIHRMGQKNKVQIINLIAQGTIESEMLTKLKFKSSMAAGILDNGESSVFLSDSKFNELVQQVQDLTENGPQTQTTNQMEEEPEQSASQVSDPSMDRDSDKGSVSKNGKHKQQPHSEPLQPKPATAKEPENQTTEANDLITAGTGFLSNLLETLSDQTKTEALINTLVRKDESTGNTVIQIPVKSKEVVENGLKLLSQILGSFGK